eukprot:CAMPEP_0184693360 /NCGR_PEP_ID=MMETSP0313-20130426/1593_1 /TAXON_ID=2792 /ORGANISM="Porphyridium aerugineum, Strain SAG 1380-2" /LENGTH=526 /DNA_ID=CAMNT_0027151421 /DNA_START=394 /DNA_END=1974 /DNA_ORIENTATION=+
MIGFINNILASWPHATNKVQGTICEVGTGLNRRVLVVMKASGSGKAQPPKKDKAGNKAAPKPSSSSSKTATTTSKPSGNGNGNGNSKQPVYINLTQDAGVKKLVLVPGTGKQVQAGDTVTITYEARLLDKDEVVDGKSKDDKYYFVVGENKVIKGWEVAVKEMKVGEKAEVICAPEYAFGARGAPPKIPRNASLRFVMEVIDSGIGGADIIAEEAAGNEGPHEEVEEEDEDFDEDDDDEDDDVQIEASSDSLEMPNFEKMVKSRDFAAEGVTDDVGPMGKLFGEDISFGIEDSKDPFKEDEAKVKSRSNVTEDGGVVKTITKAGTGGFPEDGSTVKVHYVGTLQDGKEFDSSYKRREPFSFVVGAGKVIKGWDEVLRTMSIGEKATVVISPEYAYGKRGVPPVIPSNATLTFDIELLSVEGERSKKTFADFNTDVPRTPESISRAYEDKMVEKKNDKTKKSLFERFYFISPFASQTGESPPWWLNPNITFSIVIVTVAIAFYIVIKAGGVHTGYYNVDDIDVNLFK